MTKNFYFPPLNVQVHNYTVLFHQFRKIVSSYSTNMHSRLFLLIAMFVALVNAAISSSNEPAALSTWSGKKIPMRLLKTAFGEETIASSELLYEFTAGNKLVNAKKSIDLSVLRSSQPLTATYTTVNAEPSTQNHGLLRSGGGYDVAYSRSGKMVGVWGPSISLIPVDSTAFPGVFVNTNGFRTAKRSVEASFRNFNPSLDMTGVSPSVAGSPRGNACKRRSVTRDIEMAVVTDNSLCAQHGDSPFQATTYVLGAISVVNKAFTDKTCLRLVVSYLEIHCRDRRDPYKRIVAQESSPKLNAFKSIWQRDRRHVKRDIALFLPGHIDRFGTAGGAYINGMCSEQSGYVWAEYLNPAFIAHELGHSLGAEHTLSGLMKGRLAFADPLVFSAVSVNEMSNFVDGSSRCLTNRFPGHSCALGLSRGNAMRCASSKLGDMRIRGMRRESKVSASLEQRSGRFSVMLRGNNHAQIQRVGVHISTLPYNTQGDMKFKTFSSLLKQGQIAVPLTDVKKDVTDITCCGEQIYIFISIRICEGSRASQCGLKLFTFRTTFKCFRCSSNRRFVPMVPSRACPRCT